MTALNTKKVEISTVTRTVLQHSVILAIAWSFHFAGAAEAFLLCIMSDSLFMVSSIDFN